MIAPKPEERIHIETGPGTEMVAYNGQNVYCLTRKKDRCLLYTADCNIGRAAGLVSNHKGDFLSWVPAADISAVSAD